MSQKMFRKKATEFIIAVKLDLETAGFSYEKWGSEQTCKAGDWVVSNNGNCYTISADSFARTYREVERGRYIKITPIWAEEAKAAGKVKTNEGSTVYLAGDYIVSNNADGSDSYAISKESFLSMYEPDTD